MSRTNPSICCSMCGRIIYEPLMHSELQRKKYAKHVSDYYVVNNNGKEDELCPQCYCAWEESEE